MRLIFVALNYLHKSLHIFLITILFLIWSTLSVKELLKTLTLQM